MFFLYLETKSTFHSLTSADSLAPWPEGTTDTVVFWDVYPFPVSTILTAVITPLVTVGTIFAYFPSPLILIDGGEAYPPPPSLIKHWTIWPSSITISKVL